VTSQWQWIRQHAWWLIAGAAIIIGIALRVWQFGSVPVSLYWDEMAIWDDALSVAATGRDMHGRSALQPLFISYGDYKLPVYIWLTTPITWLTKNMLVGTRLVSLLAGLSMIPAVWLLAKRLGLPKPVQWLSAAGLALLPWSIHFSRVGFEGHLAAALVLWSMVFTLQWRRPPKRLWTKIGLALGVWLLATAAFYTYYSVRFVWPVLFGSVVILWWPELKRSLRWLALIGIFWVLALIPMLRADFYSASNQIRLSTTNVLNQPERPHEVNLYRLRTGNQPWARVVFTQRLFMARDLGVNLLKYFDPQYLFDTGDPNLRHGNGFTGLTWWVTAPFLLIGLLALWREHRRVSLFLGMWWLISLLPAAVPLEIPHALRSLNALPVLPLLTAAGVWFTWQNLNRWGRWLVFGVVSAGLWFEVFSYSVYYFTIYPVASAEEWQDGYLQLAQFVSQETGNHAEVMAEIKDDRFYLYYLPFSHLSWDEIQQSESVDFKRYHLENIWFEPQAELEINKIAILNIKRFDEPEIEGKNERIIYGRTGKPYFVAYD